MISPGVVSAGGGGLLMSPGRGGGGWSAGPAGGVGSGEMGVSLASAGGGGGALVAGGVSLPASWTEDRDRCGQARVPAEVGFATKPELARVMIARAVAAGVPFG